MPLIAWPQTKAAGKETVCRSVGVEKRQAYSSTAERRQVAKALSSPVAAETPRADTGTPQNTENGRRAAPATSQGLFDLLPHPAFYILKESQVDFYAKTVLDD